MILQLVCGQKDNPKYLQINSQINYQLVGISENENAKFQLFPNPVQDELTISGISEASTYEIIDRNGRLILTGNLSVVETKINVTNLYNGNYILYIYFYIYHKYLLQHHTMYIVFSYFYY